MKYRQETTTTKNQTNKTNTHKIHDVADGYKNLIQRGWHAMVGKKGKEKKVLVRMCRKRAH